VDEKYSIKQRVMLFIGSLIGPLLIRLYGLTWRVRWDGMDELAATRQSTDTVLFCFWHSRLLGLCYTHRYRNIGIMVSKSYDGEWITRIVTKLGYRAFRGSASRDGAPALRQMILDDRTGDLALTVDGPRGPAQMVKPGAVLLAARSGLPVVPITFVPSSAWRLRSWDRFIIPKPFSTVTVRYGAPIVIPCDITDADIERFSALIAEGIKGIG
jgi:lysophospholipid acyltransferase (LPLAT)-like uncharacterized protein